MRRVRKHGTPQTVALGMAAALSLSLAACSFSDSSASISESVSSPFTSSSKSSGSDGDEAYKEDVRDATAAHILAGGATASLRQRVGELAAEHGVSNWEASASTYEAIGAGLAKAKYRKVEADTFIAGFAESDAQKIWMHDGYEHAIR